MSTHTQPADPLRIFISHPSSLFTDHRSFGDGLLAYQFIRRLALRGHRMHVAVQDVALRDTLPAGVVLHDAKPRVRLSTLRAPESAIRIRRIFEHLQRERRFDIIHQLNPVEAGLSRFLLGSGVPLVLGPYLPLFPERFAIERPVRTTLLGAVGARITVPVMRRWERRQQLEAAALLLSSPAAASSLQQPLPARKVHVLPYGVDTERFTPELSDGHRSEPVILFLANLTEQKGILELLDAFERVHVTSPSARLRIAGGGPLEDVVRQRIADSPSRERIEAIGKVDASMVPDEMRRCDLYCLPSRREGFGATVLEAMASGKPVVAMNEGGPAHLVTDAGGILVRPGSVDELSAALLALLVDPLRRRRMGEHNRRLVESRFSWESVTDRLEAIYRGAQKGRADGEPIAAQE